MKYYRRSTTVFHLFHLWIMLHDDSSYYVLYTDKECKELHEPEENVKGDTHLYAEIKSYEDYEETEDEV